MHVLVTAASRHGATAELAAVIAEQLAALGVSSDLQAPEDVAGVTGYDAVVLGSAVYTGRWLEPATELVRRCGAQLSERPVWLLSSGPIGVPPKPDEDPADAAAMVAAIGAREHRVFAGKLDRQRLGVAERLVVGMVRAPTATFGTGTPSASGRPASSTSCTRTGPMSKAALPLALSVPIAVLAMVASLAGLLGDGTYAAETTSWAAQAVGQDVANVMVAYPALLVLAWLAHRGSVRAYMAWLGVLAYSAYSYLLYAGFLHFSGWFLVYVAVFGLSLYTLVAGLTSLRPTALPAAFPDHVRARWAGRLLVMLGVLFAAVWLSEIVPAALVGRSPSAAEAGLVTNPVHLLDLGIVLPAMVLTGVLLVRRRPVGYLLAVPLYAFGAVMGMAVLAMFASLAAAGEPVATAPVALMGAVVAVEVAVLSRLLAGVPAELGLNALLAPRSRAATNG